MHTELLQRLVGKTCWHVSAGGVTVPSFVLVTGAKVPRLKRLNNKAQPRVYRMNRGSVELMVWCTWRLEGPGEVVASSDQGEEGIPSLRNLVGGKISDVKCKPPARDLTIDFDDGKRLSVFCDHVDNKTTNTIPNWELWLPKSVLVAGPGASLELSEAKLL